MQLETVGFLRNFKHENTALEPLEWNINGESFCFVCHNKLQWMTEQFYIESADRIWTIPPTKE